MVNLYRIWCRDQNILPEETHKTREKITQKYKNNIIRLTKLKINLRFLLFDSEKSSFPML